MFDACTSRYTHGGFRGFTNRFEGWEQTVETEGCREPEIGMDARARESCAGIRVVFARGGKRACAQVSTQEEVRVPRGVVGW